MNTIDGAIVYVCRRELAGQAWQEREIERWSIADHSFG